MDMRPISIVQDHGLREFVTFLEPGYVMPSHTHIAHKIRLSHSEGIGRLQATLSKEVDALALMTDAWTSRACQSYATTTAHFISDDWTLQRCVLEIIHFPGSHTAVRIVEKLKAAVDRFKVDHSKVQAVVHDQAANVELAGELL